ncbi:MAG TPA: tetratricopeptide repeat protein [Saprospiraceae bacterium]|nr:tetratricopeptide repeat protein [Saprospiraceae bacterium]
MEQRTKRDLVLKNIVSDFETKIEKGEVGILDEKLLFQLVDYYDNEMQMDKALEVIEIAIEQYKYRSEFLIIKSKLLLNMGLVEDCLYTLNEAEIIAPYEIEISIIRARALGMNSKFDEALSITNDLKTYARGGDLVDILVAESHIYEQLGDVNMMFEVLNNSLRIDSNNKEALNNVLPAVVQSKKFNEGIELHEFMLDENPYNYLAWYNIGHFYCYINEYEKAADAFEYAFIIEPDFEDAYLECAEIYLLLNNHKKALKFYKEALSVFGDDSDLLFNIAKCQFELKLYPSAKQNLLKALKHDQYNDEIYHLLGECYSKMDNWYSAINAYQKALAIEEDREEYYIGIAKAYAAIEDYGKATLNFQMATEINDQDSHVWAEYISFILKLGLYKEALQIVEEADYHTYGADLLYCKAAALFFLKRKKSGLKILEEALIDDIAAKTILFNLAPELEVDKEIAAMVSYYISESE